MALEERIYQLPAATSPTATAAIPFEDPANANITQKMTPSQLPFVDANRNTVIGQTSGSAGLSAHGTDNTVVGDQNLNGSGTGTAARNVAIGELNLRSTVNDVANYAIGYNNLSSLNGGNYNIAIGDSVMINLGTGSRNIVIGGIGTAGVSFTTSESNNLILGGSTGIIGNSGVTQIGFMNGSATQTKCFVDGIAGVSSSGFTGALPVVVDSVTGQLAPATNIPTLNGANTYTKAQAGAFVTLTDAATVAIDSSLANNFNLTLGGNRTLGVPTNMVAGRSGVISVRQDITGTRTLAYAWVYEFPGAIIPVLSTAALTFDQLNYMINFYATATVTITIAAPGVVTWTSHGLISGQKIQLTTTGALPTGLSINTSYWVTVVDANTFKLSTSLATARAATFITTTGSQSGVHTAVSASITLSNNNGIA